MIALTCFLIVGAAGAAILGRDSVPAAGAAMPPSAVFGGSISNWEGKGDRLDVASTASAPSEPPQTGAIPSDPMRPALAADNSPREAEALKTTDRLAARPMSKPKLASKPPSQKSYALLSEAQIAGIKDRLRLSPSQESYWPAVENALRAVARRIHATRQAEPNGTAAPIDPQAEEVQQLKSAAMPLLFQLREDQKREVRALARLIGLEKVAAAI